MQTGIGSKAKVVAVIAALAATIAGGVAQAQQGEVEFADFEQIEPGIGEGITIGYINAGDSSPYWANVSASMAEQAGIAGAALINCDTNFDPARSLECARNFVTAGVDVIISSNIDSKTAPEVCAAGPDVPTLATWIKQEPCEVAFFGSDDIAAGMVFGSALGEYFQENFGCEYDAFVSLEQPQAGEANTNRMAGARQGFESACGPVEEVRVVDTEGRLETAQIKFADVLTSLGDADQIAVVSLNDDSAVGAVAAAEAAGRQDDIYVASAGGDSISWCQIQNNPNWVGSVGYFPEKQGEITIRYAIMLAKGEPVAPTIYMNQPFLNADNLGEFYTPEGC
jgi:ribose transport system substrate-binding protein